MRSTHFLSVCRFGTAFLEQSSMVPNVRNGVELSMVMAPFQIYLSFQQFFAETPAEESLILKEFINLVGCFDFDIEYIVIMFLRGDFSVR